MGGGDWAELLATLRLGFPRWCLSAFGLAVVGAAFGLLAVRGKGRDPGSWRWILALVGLGLGLGFVIRRAALVDDAFITFRYARHFAEGRGLTWNDGERVEGYTNFLWTVLLGGATWLSGIEPAFWGLFGSVACWILHVAVVLRVADRLLGSARPVVPVAALLVALHPLLTAAGTTGLETALAVLLLDISLLFLALVPGPRTLMLAGLFFTLGTLNRPDHLIFYATGGLGLLLDRAGGGGWRVGRTSLLSFFAPGLLLVAHQSFRLHYYGESAPNTFFAKSADQAWWSQGLLYAATFWLGGLGVLLLVPGLVGGLALVRSGPRRVGVTVVVGTLIFLVYVTRVGGDFMWGRFYAALIAPLALGVEVWIARSRPWVAAAVGAIVACSLLPLPGFPPARPIGGIIDESAVYHLAHWWPVQVDHRNFRSAKLFQRWAEAGARPTLATGGIGMVGYYSDLPLIDLRGLTDRTVAHNPLRKRGRPGHEKEPPPGYLEARGVDLVRAVGPGRDFHPARFRRITALDLGPEGRGDPWQLARWEPKTIAALRASDPKITFSKFPEWLDQFAQGLPGRPADEAAADLAWLTIFYLQWNDDPRFTSPVVPRDP